jgi:hypothetical protein
VNHEPQSTWGCFAHTIHRIAAALLLLAHSAASPSRANADMADWEHDWVALTVAQNGTWGAASNANLTRAMMQAIRDCARKSGSVGNDCGAEITTVRASWSLAYGCGDYTFISNGATPADARIAAIERAIDLKEIVGLALPPCALVVAIDPEGRILPAAQQKEILAIPVSGR